MSTTATHDGLLQAILAEPDADDLRLIFADWLDQNGQPQRAEFIRIQIALANWPCECDSEERIYYPECRCNEKFALRRRERELLTPRNVLTWLAPSPLRGPCYFNDADNHGWVTTSGVVFGPEQTCRAVFRRGFIEEAILPCADWLAHGVDLVQQWPLKRVRLSDKEPYQYSGRPKWFWFFAREDVPLRYRMPQHCLLPAEWARQESMECRGFGWLSRESAEQALSTACLAWACQQAGMTAPASVR